MSVLQELHPGPAAPSGPRVPVRLCHGVLLPHGLAHHRRITKVQPSLRLLSDASRGTAACQPRAKQFGLIAHYAVLQRMEGGKDPRITHPFEANMHPASIVHLEHLRWVSAQRGSAG